MKTPFKNDPFALIWQAFKNLYPGKECECFWDPDIQADGDSACGFTNFADDGTVGVYVSGALLVSDAAEILAHELAHVAVGLKHEHDEVWERSFGDINDEYNRLVALRENYPEEFETVRRATERARSAIRKTRIVVRHQDKLRDSYIVAIQEWRENNKALYDNVVKTCYITWGFISLSIIAFLILSSF